MKHWQIEKYHQLDVLQKLTTSPNREILAKQQKNHALSSTDDNGYGQEKVTQRNTCAHFVYHFFIENKRQGII